MDITLYRGDELGREHHALPAPVYNLAKRLIARSPSGIVFVPIRSMQHLAVLEREEFLFIDHLDKTRIRFAWQHFHPQTRSSLEDAVPYEVVFYHPDALAIMQRLMGEFPKALQQVEDRDRIDAPARVLKFERRGAN